METLEIGGAECRVIRSPKRRSVCIRIADDGVAELLIPAYMSLSEALAVGEKYAGWIRLNREKRVSVNESRAGFTLSVGDKVRCLGGWRTVTAHDRNTVGYDEAAFYVPRGCEGERLRQAVITVYRLLAKNFITSRVNEISARMKLRPESVKINAARSHWATCSKRNTLNFSWYAVMASPEAVDYIVIHELCHMLEFNHTPRFWSLVAEYCPDYPARKDELRSLWSKIQSENWE